jgi:predicted RNA-binding Zn-ribbon protein involved in translation (DUF1610 family)
MGMVARQARAEIEVEVPEADEPIERWGSIIRWREILGYPEFKGGRTWGVKVQCGSCKLWRLVPIYDLNPAAGELNADCLLAPGKAESIFGGYTGLCSSCFMRLARPDVEYHDGTKLFRRQRTKDGLTVFCGACKKEIFLRCALSEKLYDKHWDCPNCGWILGKWLHEQSGATVYWLRRQEGQRNNVAFDCAGCGGAFYCKDDLPKRAAWLGMCPRCQLDKHPLAIKGVKPLPGSGKEIKYENRFGEGKPPSGKKRNRWGIYVLVPCPLPGCGKQNKFHFDTTRKPGFIGLCKPGKKGHTRDEIASFFLSLAAGGQQDGGGEKAGRKKWTNDGEDKFLSLYETVLKRIHDQDPTLPGDVKELLKLRNVKPSDVARDHAARLFGVEPNEYLIKVLGRARQRRDAGGGGH